VAVTQKVDGCVVPAKGPIRSKENTEATGHAERKEEPKMTIARVGRPAPDFEASAYIEHGFRNIRLSEFIGKWVIVCFYPGDFTFV
jgi:peroxiredoxin (alkyl hydroperoxide reductase subunit C)